MSSDFKPGHGLEYEQGDLIISGGELHFVEDVPTASISANAMDVFLKQESDRLDREKASVAARAARRSDDSDDPDLDPPTAVNPLPPAASKSRPSSAQISAVLSSVQSAQAVPAPSPAVVAKRPSAAEITAALKKATATGDAVMSSDATKVLPASALAPVLPPQKSGAGVSPAETAPSQSASASDGGSTVASGAMAAADGGAAAEGIAAGAPEAAARAVAAGRESAVSGAGGPMPPRRSSRRAATSMPGGKKPRKPVTSTEKWIYAFIAICVLGGTYNFVFKPAPPPPPEAPEAPKPKLAEQDRIWAQAEGLAYKAQEIMKDASKEYNTGDKDKGSELYKEADDLWVQVFAKIDEIEEKFKIDLDEPRFARWSKKLRKWQGDQQECVKLQTLDKDDFDFEEELRKAKEKNRLPE